MSDETLEIPVADDVRRALAEDVGPGDVTAALVPAEARMRGTVTCREAAVICGRPWFDEVFAALDAEIAVAWRVEEGAAVAPDTVVCEVQGPARAVLTGERTALNFLQLLSGVATESRRWAEQVAGTGTTVLDTRKTLPGLRAAQKYAVRTGGCRNHRIGLFDMVLIKENHIRAAGSIRAAVDRARELHPRLTVEVEVESLAELDLALAAGADIVMLDDFAMDTVREAVARTAGRARLEVSGNVSLERLPALAASGVDYVSSGSLTKHVRAVDLSMRFG
jgi:nicotinate-nucleotide pyrophosphorylase (carboxylating)